MRNSLINTQKVYYSKVIFEDIIDDNGYRTGEKKWIYLEIKEMWINTSPASGQEILALFGQNAVYDKVLVTSNLSLPFNEESKDIYALWINIKPSYARNKLDHNYELKRVAKGLNTMIIGVNRIDKNE